MKLAFIGIGKLGRVLAERFWQHGHEIVVAHNNIESPSVQEIMTEHADFLFFPVQKAVDEADIVFLSCLLEKLKRH
jgi:Predicted dinucleotide-binding enzymes